MGSSGPFFRVIDYRCGGGGGGGRKGSTGGWNGMVDGNKVDDEGIGIREMG